MSDALSKLRKRNYLKAMDKEISKPNAKMNKHTPKMIMTVKESEEVIGSEEKL